MAGRTIYVGNLSSQLTEDIVTGFFSCCGQVTQVRLAGDPAYAARFCFIEFATPEAAQQALALNGSELDGRRMRVTLSKNPILKDSASPMTNMMYTNTRHMNAYTSYGLPQGNPQERIARTVYISGIGHEMPEEHVLQFFSICGPVVQFRLCGDMSHPSRYAFIEFMTVDAARIAHGLTGVTLGFSTIRIMPSRTAIMDTVPQVPLAKLMDPVYRDKVGRTIYVGSVDVNATEYDLMQLFGSVGLVTKLCLTGDTMHTSRFAFIEFSRTEEAHAALNLNGTVFGSKTLRVSLSKTPIHAPTKDVLYGPGAAISASQNALTTQMQTLLQQSQETPLGAKESRNEERKRRRSRSRSKERDRDSPKRSRRSNDKDGDLKIGKNGDEHNTQNRQSEEEKKAERGEEETKKSDDEEEVSKSA